MGSRFASLLMHYRSVAGIFDDVALERLLDRSSVLPFTPLTC
jgi:hypothetical protein